MKLFTTPIKNITVETQMRFHKANNNELNDTTLQTFITERNLLEDTNTVINTSHYIGAYFDYNKCVDALVKLGRTFKEYKVLDYYTDGSLQNANTLEAKMGIGWVAINDQNVIGTFSAQIRNWPSSTRCEIVALLSALCTAPIGSTITIHIDS